MQKYEKISNRTNYSFFSRNISRNKSSMSFSFHLKLHYTILWADCKKALTL